MQNLPNLSALDISLVWITLVSLGWFAYSFFELRKLNKKIKHSRLTEDKKWKEIEEKAQKDYAQLIEAANKKAEEIIQNANKISFDASTSLKQAVDKAISDHKSNIESASLTLENKYAGEIEEINKHNIQLLTNVYKDIETNAKTHFEEYQKILQNQSLEAEKQAKTRIDQEYARLQSDLAAVREQKISELATKVNGLVTSVARDVIGKSLDSTTQANLITQSLDQAKKEGVI